MNQQTWDDFEARMREIVNLARARAVVQWDQQVMMPPGGAAARAGHSATLAGIAHEKLTDDRLGGLIDELRGADLPPDKAKMVERLAHDRDRAVKIPAKLASDLAHARAEGQTIWQQARVKDDFEMFRPALERLLALKEQEAEAVGYDKEPYEAHLETYERGVSVDEVESTFSRIAQALQPLIDALDERPTDRGLPPGPHDIDKQLAYCRDLAARLGLDPDKSRLDLSAHPFTTYFAIDDVRITTRLYEHDPMPSILATMHETGHALYGAGLPVRWAGTSIGGPASSGANESQSRLWENHVGRTLAFWEGEITRLHAAIPSLVRATAKDIFLAVNQAGPSLIRVDADELTYPLHIILRFELELAICRGELKAGDLPGAWNEAMERHLRIRPPSDADGVMQDVHWSTGLLGYFPTYLLGSMWSAAIFNAACEALGGEPAVEDQLRAGEFRPLLGYLTEHLYSKGQLHLGREYVEQICGRSDDIDPYVAHLRGRREAVAALS